MIVRRVGGHLGWKASLVYPSGSSLAELHGKKERYGQAHPTDSNCKDPNVSDAPPMGEPSDWKGIFSQ